MVGNATAQGRVHLIEWGRRLGKGWMGTRPGCGARAQNWAAGETVSENLAEGSAQIGGKGQEWVVTQQQALWQVGGGRRLDQGTGTT